MKKTGMYVTLGIILILILGGLVYFIYNQTQQSVLSVSKVNVGSDGKVYWTYYASANKPNEQYIFTSKPSTYTTNDGTKVTPKSTLTLVISPKEKKCIYQLKKSTYNSRYPYYVLSNPTRSAMVEFADGNNQVETINGATNKQVVFNDADGKGSLVVETQGLLMSESDCPDYDNVAILLDQKTGTYAIGYKNEVDNWIDAHTGLFCTLGGVFGLCDLGTNYQDNIPFTSSFTSPLKVSDTQVIGTINFGNPTFTITADSDYFDSTYYVEPKLADPSISKINVPDEIKQDLSDSGTVEIKNNGEKGSVSISLSSDTFSVSNYPSSFILDKSQIISFTIKAPNTVKDGKITAKVCSVSQFNSAQNCDTKSATISIISSSSTPTTYCGDKICQSNENYNNCPSDCSKSPTPPQLECTWYQTLRQTSSCGFLGSKCWFGGSPAQVQECKLSSWVYVIVILLILILIASFFVIKWRIQR